ncbi:CTR2 [Candida pseudojiufengensis]|uniref:CTR2 n=1 Tax=Candida pseudojiufengensis TaxID=497109 RepID=UPI002224B050|nr:CTR2 [Candida pseudojiufengensis]KAI5960161.1 CTR2 [Candida pseudojiufengensis]
MHEQTSMMHEMPSMPEDRCSMNMLFTWDWHNVCIVYKWWHIKTFPGFVISLIAVAVISSFYELLKKWFSHWERTSNAPLPRFKLQRALLYGLQVYYSFLLMLVFMTYNGWYMISVAVGAAIGNYLWGGMTESSRNLSCH